MVPGTFRDTSADHAWTIDAQEYERHEQRRGRRHAFVELTPRQTALVVVDMIPFFCEANAYARGVVPRINDLAAAARRADALVCWVVPTPTEPTPVQIEHLGEEVAHRYATSAGTGAPRRRLWDELVVSSDDVVAEKQFHSAFFPGSSRLPDILSRRGIDTVMVAGTVASVCCESTARDAATLGFRTIMVADAVAGGSDDELNATLRTIYRSYGDVRSTAELIELLSTPRRP